MKAGTKTAKVRVDKKNKIKTSNWQFWLIIAVPAIYAFVFAYIPMGGILMAFKDYSIRKGYLAAIGWDLNIFSSF